MVARWVLHSLSFLLLLSFVLYSNWRLTMSDIFDSDSHSAIQAAVRRELRSLTATVDATVEHLPVQQAAEVVRLLRETGRSIQTMGGAPIYGTIGAPSPDPDLERYFPVTDSPFGRLISAEEREIAQERWTTAVARGQSYRAPALEQIGPLLTPHQASERLGISVTTVNNWRHRRKLLGVRFDDHQYLYPTWQFVDSPTEGHSGVLHRLHEVLVSLGGIHPWEKARFFLGPQPLFGGRTPLEIIRNGTLGEIERLKDLAARRGEIGT
jgi:hypothetical protein